MGESAPGTVLPTAVNQQSLKLRSDIKEMLHPPVQATNSLKSSPFSQDLDLYVFMGIKQQFLQQKGMPGLSQSTSHNTGAINATTANQLWPQKWQYLQETPHIDIHEGQKHLKWGKSGEIFAVSEF